MRDYGKVHTTFWSSETTGSLSDDGRLLALYLLTSSHTTIAGVFRLPDGYVAEDLNWPMERVIEGFRELSDKGFASRCATTKWVWIVKHLLWNPPENPNQRKSAAKCASGVPSNCTWRVRFFQAWGEYLGLTDPKADCNPSATVGQPLLNQEQEQKAGTGTKAGTAAETVSAAVPAACGAEAPSKRGTRLPADWVLPKAWGEWAVAKYPHWTPDTVRAIAGKFRNYWVAKAGRDATKLDWKATWENWCQSGITQEEHQAPKSGAVKAELQRDESLAKAERLQRARAAGGGQVAPAADLSAVPALNPLIPFAEVVNA